MAQTTNDIKNGSVLNLDGQLWTVTKFQHVKPGKGPAFVRTTIKNVLSGKIVDKTFNAGMKMEFETVDNRNLQYSYEDGDNFVFMDMTTYDQVYIPKTLVGDQAKFLLEGTDCVVSFHDGTPLSVELPASVILTITHTEPGLQATAPTPAPSPPPSRPAPRSRSRCSWAKARRSRSTPATAPTSAARTESKDNRLPWHVPPLAKGL
mgnify:FL=1